MRRSLLGAFASLFLMVAGVAGAEFELNGQRFTLPDGLIIEHVAGTPLVDRPVSADFDERGRLYVTDSSGSNEHVDVQRVKRPHRIVRLVDTDGDGHFDKSTVFADKLMFPEGSLWHDGSLYVAAPPEIWKFTDADDDGVAEKREVWFDGKTLTHCANDLHGPYLGPDGWIYWCKGAFAEQSLARHNLEPIKSKAAHVFRRRPEGGPLEYVMSGGMDNPVELVFTPSGERIFTTTFLVHPRQGQRDGLIHAVYGGLYGKDHSVLDNHPRTGELLPALAHLGAAAPCGLARLESNGLGDGFRDNVLASSFNMHKITRHVLRKAGGTFHSTTTDLLTSDNLDFHPTDVLEDADGSLIVVDTGGWFRLCCPTSQLEKADVLGGVYRIRSTSGRAVADPRGLRLKWEAAAIESLVKRLADNRFTVRQRAARQLAGRSEAAQPLRDLLESSTDPAVRRNIVWTLASIDGKAARGVVRDALSDPDESVRCAALHSISLHRDSLAAGQLLRELDADRPAHVRRTAAEALGRVGGPEHVQPLLQAVETATLEDGKADRFLEHSLIYAAMEINDEAAIRASLRDARPRIRRAALIALDQIDGGRQLRAEDLEPLLTAKDETLHSIGWWLAERHPEWSDLAVESLRPMLSGLPKEAERRATLRSRLAKFSNSAALQKLMADALSDAKQDADRLTILGAMQDRVQKPFPPVWRKPIIDLLSGSDDVVQAALTALNRSAKGMLDDATMKKLFAIAADGQRDSETRLRALLLVPANRRAMEGETLEFVCSQLSVDASVTTRALAVDTVDSSRLNASALKRLARQLPSTGAMELRPLLEVFAKSKDQQVGAELVASLRKSPAATSLFPDQLESLVAAYGPTVAASAKPLLRQIALENQSKVARVQAVLELLPKADTRRGLKVFQGSRASCIACHRRGYLGGDIGPDLNRIGRIRSERDLLESILFPSLSFVRSFEPATIQTDDGRVLNGMVRRETKDTLTLQIDAKRSTEIAKSRIEDRRMGTVSIMPAGLEKQLSLQELADLVKYLKEQ